MWYGGGACYAACCEDGILDNLDIDDYHLVQNL